MVKKLFSPELAQSAGLAINRLPETKEEVAKAEKVLAKELQKLSLEEHEQILFSVHGLPRCTLEDDYVAMEARLKDLAMELENVEGKDREVYDLVRARNPTYVESTQFRLLFLRSESYDAKATAEKMVGHFKAKKELFGEGEILWRDVRQSDLNTMDIKLLEMGFMQFLPSRDVAGRAVMALYPNIMQLGTKETLMLPLTRASWYFTMTMMQDEETQKNGVVSIMYNFCANMENVSLDAPATQLHRALPQRIEAAHFCSCDPVLRTNVTGVQLFIDPSARFRLRPHVGTPQEINFELQTYGIQTQDSPMKDDGTWSNEWHLEWLKAQRVREEKLATTAPPPVPTDAAENDSQQPRDENDNDDEDIILVPRRFDVLFGRGKHEREHTGNLRAMHVCDMHWEGYESSQKFVKTEMAEKIVHIIQQSGGRFLKPNKDGVGWVEADDAAAREKIAHFFRFKRSRKKSTPPPLEESSTSDSSTNRVSRDEKGVTSPLTKNLPQGDDSSRGSSKQARTFAKVNTGTTGIKTPDFTTINLVPV